MLFNAAIPIGIPISTANRVPNITLMTRKLRSVTSAFDRHNYRLHAFNSSDGKTKLRNWRSNKTQQWKAELAER
jgi:hypothetical protein